jgi:hypothetical protein
MRGGGTKGGIRGYVGMGREKDMDGEVVVVVVVDIPRFKYTRVFSSRWGKGHFLSTFIYSSRNNGT